MDDPQAPRLGDGPALLPPLRQPGWVSAGAPAERRVGGHPPLCPTWPPPACSMVEGGRKGGQKG